MLFTNKKTNITCIYTRWSITRRKERAEDLGVVFDSHLRFNEDILKIAKKAYKSLRNCCDFQSRRTHVTLITYAVVCPTIYRIHSLLNEFK